MPLSESFAVGALAAGITTNIATDILTHRASGLENSFVGRALKWAGFAPPTFQERLKDSLEKALRLYFTEFKERQALGVDEFFQNPVVVGQIAECILSRKLPNEVQLQQEWENHLSTKPVYALLNKDQGLQAANIIHDFLTCYRRVLREQLSVPELAITYDLLEQQQDFVDQLQESEERLKTHIAEIVDRRLSSQAQIQVYEAGQQELATGLTQEMITVGLVEPDQTVQVIQARLEPIPDLFRNGLCKGRLLQADPGHYFVAHGFGADVLPDWRQSLTEALAEASGDRTPLEPYFSGDRLLGGFRLCGICEQLFTSRFSMFLLPPSQDRNVYLELGIAIAIGAPFFLIQHYEARIPGVLEGLSRYVKGGLFRRMRRELAGQIEEYDFGVVHFVGDLPQAGSQPKYLVSGGELIEDEDFEGSIEDALGNCYPHLEMVSLTNQLAGPETAGWVLEQLVTSIQACQFAIYRVDEDCSPTTFLALGISIGLNRPFLMMHRANRDIPLDLRGMGMYEFPHFTGLQQNIIPRHQEFFDRYAQ